ncbi:MAG TPA: hypothetical protein VGV85_06195, partial [Longimicrobiaceae bacterium]|nr:hypothetical protein [Longimicrobiaceae bacterium]
MQQILRRLFKQYFGKMPASVLPLEGDGSSRSMYRVVGDTLETAIGVVGPDREENRAFISYSRDFRSVGLPVPQVYAADEEAGVYLEEDLGDSTLFDALSLARQTDGSDFPAEMVPVDERVLE